MKIIIFTAEKKKSYYIASACKSNDFLFSASPTGQGSFSSDTETVLLTQHPRMVTPVVQGDLGSKVNCTLEKSVEESGGVAAILFLVAKVTMWTV